MHLDDGADLGDLAGEVPELLGGDVVDGGQIVGAQHHLCAAPQQLPSQRQHAQHHVRPCARRSVVFMTIRLKSGEPGM